jgi:hypothetical protein
VSLNCSLPKPKCAYCTYLLRCGVLSTGPRLRMCMDPYKPCLTLYYSTHRHVWEDKNLAGRYSSDDLDVYSRGAQFESRPDSVYPDWFFVVFLIFSKKSRVITSIRPSLLPSELFSNSLFIDCPTIETRYNSVGIATGYELDDRGVGVRVTVRAKLLFSPRRPDQFWGPLSLLSSGYRELISPGITRSGVKLITQLQLMPRSRKYGSIHPLCHTLSWRSA